MKQIEILQSQIFKLANQLREESKLDLSDLLISIGVDLGLICAHQQKIGTFCDVSSKLETEKTKLLQSGFLRAASHLDKIQRDLEAKIIQFNNEDPIASVLSGYASIHKLAADLEPYHLPASIDAILWKAEKEDLSSEELEHLLLRGLLEVPLSDRKKIIYILENDYQLDFPMLEKQASNFNTKIIDQKLQFDPSTQSKTKQNQFKQKIEKLKKRIKQKQRQDRSKYTWQGSFPSTPEMWSGFSYQAIVPYQQSSQLNFWSVASSDQILNRITKNKSKY